MEEVEIGGKRRRGAIGYVVIAVAVLINLRFAQSIYVGFTQFKATMPHSEWQKALEIVVGVWIVFDIFLGILVWATRGKISADGAPSQSIAKSWQHLFASQETRQARQSFIDAMDDLYEAGNWSASNLLEQAAALGVEDDDVRRLIKAFAQPKINAVTKPLLDKEIISPDEYLQIEAICARLKGIELEEKTSEAISHARYLWTVYHDPLPPVDANVLLQRGEKCFLATRCEVTEHRTETARVGYSGPSVRLRLSRHVSYRMGSYSVQRTKRDVTFSHGLGDIYATDKRLLWIGTNDTISITLGSIVRYDTYANGILVTRSRGKPLFFDWGSIQKVPTIIAERVITEMR